MSAHTGRRFSAAAFSFAMAASSEASPQVAKPAPALAPAGATASTATHQILALTVLPVAPEPDQPIRVRVEGNGTCKVWFGIRQLEGSTYPLPPSWNPMGVINEITRPPDATLALPGELPSLKLSAGRYKIAVDSHEGFKNGNCRGSALLEFVVAEKKPVLLQVQPGTGDSLGSKTSGGPSALASSSASSKTKGKAGAAGSATSQAVRRIVALTILPPAPEPDRPIRVHVDGNGTCKVWFGIRQIGGTTNPAPPSWNPMGVINEITRAPDATLPLPGELPSLKLPAGRYKIAADSHEGMNGNCKGSALLEFVVAEKKPVLLQVQPAAGGALGTKSTGGPSALASSSSSSQTKAGGGATGAEIVQAVRRIDSVTILPAAPEPDQPVHVRVDGNGTCKVWFGIRQLDGATSPLPPGWNPMGVINEITRPPDATLALPGELPPLKLPAGRYKIAADSHEGMNGNCKGYSDLEFRVAARAPIVLAAPPGGVAPQAPALVGTPKK